MFGISIGHMIGKLTKLYIIVNTQKINNKLELSTAKINKYLEGVSKKNYPTLFNPFCTRVAGLFMTPMINVDPYMDKGVYY